MNPVLVLVRKEFTESLRNGKWIWLPVALIILGISQPLSLYYMPQLLEVAGGLPDGAVINIPTPDAAEVLMGTLSQFGMLGTLLFVLASMNIISAERNNGSLTFIMVRPVTEFEYILSKWLGALAIFGVSFFLSYLLTWYYTAELFSMVDITKVLMSFLIYMLWICFVLALTLFCGVLLKNGGGIAGLSISILAVLALTSSLMPAFMKWSPTNLQTEAGQILISDPTSSLWTAVISTAVFIILLLGVAVWRLKRGLY
ncbi:ABC transporter permease [Alkalihalobacillus alcalophilus ATCC 27647 = CGMCC 1.3604]|uniref:ABC transporter permease n=1 Tax=Alkalihalobacillus alcalophilus ATCC 27647 = CGMCC 1.3604 TaxID=1218173 RepID=J8TT18_ALKAL|nr:ABC transporter permease subunit [Alkalihalobacillus alcalophilus]AFV25769.1 unknown transporter [Alkalihalobacillus alcalophilus ATCC 27647 = CGMCC 1.3604]KGA96691.1 membrane protein [Alkalihalobacillus alcalophilus ATCC 27647 = CGMCC 1.3604]MED1562377.1 ABC transporter permease subunit [Alkalihalobacillus alcalophilus]THG92008.1 ABC transporter permease [Alkalihalobacillus alcalophilus ATCC 27647 = CGMCC 1.3604]